MQTNQKKKLRISLQMTILLVCIAFALCMFGCQPANNVNDCFATIEKGSDGTFIVADMILSENSTDDVSIVINVGDKFSVERAVEKESYVSGDSSAQHYHYVKKIAIADMIEGKYEIEFKTATDSRKCKFEITKAMVEGTEDIPVGRPAPKRVTKSGLEKFAEYIGKNTDKLLQYFLEHIRNTGIAVGCAILIGVPLGIMITRRQRIAGFVLGFANVFQTIPSLAWFGLLISIMGIGMLPAVFVLFLFALLPIIKNTYIGINGVDRGVIEAATGMGMTSSQILSRIEIPLAMPVIMGGIRIATVVNIGSATIAALIGGGGLGNFIFSGIATVRYEAIILGALTASLLALFVDFLLGRVEKALTSQGVKRTKRNEREGAI